jgi:hypothetical protein
LRGTFKTIDDIDPILALLVKHLYIRPESAVQTPRAAGRPASPGYAVNPALKTGSNNTDNTENPSEQANSQYCQDSQNSSEEKNSDEAPFSP